MMGGGQLSELLWISDIAVSWEWKSWKAACNLPCANSVGITHARDTPASSAGIDVAMLRFRQL